jgi:hypothetical protein
MITKAQDIFRQKFTLIQNLSDLYNGLASRKHELLMRRNPPTSPALKISLNLLMPEYSKAVLEAHLDSVRAQEYENFTPRLIVDSRVSDSHRREIEAALASSLVAIELLQIIFSKEGIHAELKTRRLLGEVIQELLEIESKAEAFILVAPNEKLLSNHLSVLAGALVRNPEVACAATAAVLLNDGPVHSVHELIDFGHVDRNGPPGLGRFIFRMASLPIDLNIALPYLDGRPLAVMTNGGVIDQQLPASIMIFTQSEFPQRTWDDATESALIRDYCPSALKWSSGFGPQPQVMTYQPVEPRPLTMLQVLFRLLTPSWYKAQVVALYKLGFGSRMLVLRQRLGL